MFTHQGIAVGAWISLDSSCEIKPNVYTDTFEIEFGSHAGSLGLAMTEDMVDKLAGVFADAQTRFRELDIEAEQDELKPAGPESLNVWN
ncbi:hypothetical protein EV191_1011419 [Tamaricihabitans halophyticus]|uniref:Uncharacterized protein n=2 Tax=Tamaricihabitans halophyticus TaxID=1262583 RepID=A0A4R2R4G0_9PSEU|nr:hypothetical protein EV191_1011419 [Tamaricihabitans halophyticus]